MNGAKAMTSVAPNMRKKSADEEEPSSLWYTEEAHHRLEIVWLQYSIKMI